MATQSISQVTFSDLCDHIREFCAWEFPSDQGSTVRSCTVNVYVENDGCISLKVWRPFKHQQTATKKPSKAKLVRSIRAFIEERFPERVSCAHLWISHGRKLHSRRIHIIRGEAGSDE